VGPLTGYRDFVDVRDVAEAVAVAARLRTPVPVVLNVGGGRATPLRELADLAVALSGGTVAERADGPRSEIVWQQANLTSIGAALGWSPTIELSRSVRDMWESVRAR
jgi:nucleoside-diphosphate-sugar epimerase